MKLTISNIAWPVDCDNRIWSLLQSRGLSAIEVAPTRIWPEWVGATPAAAGAHRETLSQHGLRCSSVQSLLYGMPSLNLFGSPDDRLALKAHLLNVARIAAALGAGPMVFGSPGNRNRGTLSAEQAFSIAVEFFSDVGAAMASLGVCLCIEPNPTQYNCNFVTNCAEGAKLVRAVNSPGFRLHLDAAGMHLAGEDNAGTVIGVADILEHFHISEPFLKGFDEAAVRHDELAAGLKEIGWNRWVSIEMRPVENAFASVDKALTFAHDHYGAA